MQKILVPIDNSDMMTLVLAQTKDLAEHFPDAKIEVVTIVPPYMPTHGDHFDNISDIVAIMFEQADELLAKAKEILGEFGDNVTTSAIGSADIADTIVELSSRFDLIIMGTRGLSGLREYIGSVSHKVIHKSECPVLLVK